MVMSLDSDAAAAAIGAYFGPRVLHDEPIWSSILLEAAADFESAEDLRDALDLMGLEDVLRAESA